MDLATLKFKVETGELSLAIKKLEELGNKTKELTKVTSELLKADRQAAEVSLAQAKAQLQVLNVQIKQLDLDKKTLEVKTKKTQLEAKEAEVANKKATAEAKTAKAKLDAVKAEEKASKTTEKSTKAKVEHISASDALSRKIEQLASKTAFVVQGNSRAESSFLALSKSLGATESQLKQITDLFEIQRKVIGGDPFDKSASAAAKLGRELGVLNKYMTDYSQSTGLTRNQARELAREIERLTQLGKQQNLSKEQSAAIIEKETKEYIKNAQALNTLERELREKTRAATDSVKADEARARALEKVAAFESRMSARGSLTKGSAINGELLPKSVITNLVNYEQMLKRAGIAGDEFNSKMEKMKNTLVRTEQIRGVSDSLGGMTASIIKASIAMVGINSAFDAFSQYFVVADQMKNLEARMNAVGQGTTNFNRDFAQLVEISNKTGASVESVGTIFTRLLPVMENFGKGSQDALKITSNLSAILRVTGASASEASSALLQVSQAFAKGKLDGDEFRSVAENMPEVLRLLEFHTGKTRGELYLMAEQGKITAKLLSDVLGQDIEKLNKQLEQMPLTVGIANNALANSFKVLIQRFDEASGLSEMVAKGIKSIADAMNFVAQNDKALLLLQGVVGALAGIAAAGTAVMIVKGISIALGGLATALGAVGLALTGPVGILLGVAGVAGAGLMIANTKTPIEKMTDDVSKLEKKLKDLENSKGGKYGFLDVLVNGRNASKTALTSDEKKKLQSEIDLTKSQLADARSKLANQRMSDSDTKVKTSKASVIAGFSDDEARANNAVAEYSKLAAQVSDNKIAELKQKLSDVKYLVSSQNKIAADEFKTRTVNLKKDSKEYNDALAKYEADKIRIQRTAADASKQLQKEIDQELKKGSPTGSKRLRAMDFEKVDLTQINRNYEEQKSLQTKQTKFLLNDLEMRYKYGLISAEQYYTDYFALAKQSTDEVLVLEADRTAKSVAEYDKLIKQAGVALQDFKKENIGVKDYSERVADATEKYKEKVKELEEAKKTLLNTSEANKKQALNDYYNRISESVKNLAEDTYKLNKAMQDFIASEVVRNQLRKEEEIMQANLANYTEQQQLGIKAEFEERKRLTAKLEEFKREQERVTNERLRYEQIIESSTDVEQLEEAKKNLEQIEEVFKRMKNNVATVEEMLQTQPAEAKVRAIAESQRKAYAEFVDKLGDGVVIGLTKGAKAGAKNIRETIVDALKEPVVMYVKAVVSDLLGSTQGKSGNVLDSLSNVMDMFSGNSGSGQGSGLANMIGKLGSMFNSDMLSSFSAGMKGASLAPGLAGPTTAGASGITGMGASFGKALPGIGQYLAAVQIGGSLGRKISDGKSVIGKSGNTAVNAGMIIGSIFGGPLGAGIGSVVGGLVNNLFGKKKPTGSGGFYSSRGLADTTANVMGVTNGYESAAKDMTSRRNLQVRSMVQDSITQSIDQISAMSKALGINDKYDIDAGLAFDKKRSYGYADVFINGKNSGEYINRYLSKNPEEAAKQWLEGVQNTLANAILKDKSVIREGETAIAALTRLSNSLGVVNDVLKLTGNTLFEVSVKGADSASYIVEAFGGLENMQNSVTAYYDKFFTQEEKNAEVMKNITKVAADVGITLPKTKDQFKSLVSSLDLTTDSGRKAYAALVSIGPAFAEVTQSVEKLKEVSIGIKDTIKSITVSSLAPEKQFEQKLADFNTLIAEANSATGDKRVELGEKINSSLEPLINSAKDVYATGVDFFRIRDDIFAKASTFADSIGVDTSTFQKESLIHFTEMTTVLENIKESSVVTAESITGFPAIMQSIINKLRESGNYTVAGLTNKFADGGVFTNGIVSKPTSFNIGQMGEAGPEAIMPLGRTSDGSLGVTGTVNVDNTEVVEGLKENNRHLSALVRLQQSANQKLIEELQIVKDKLEGIETSSRLQALNS